jgi:hypothetical protein
MKAQILEITIDLFGIFSLFPYWDTIKQSVSVFLYNEWGIGGGYLQKWKNRIV